VVQQRLNSVYFPDNNIGYAVGDNGRILKTTNGGTAWSICTSGVTTPLNSVFFTDINTGYAIGNNGIIIKTTNGGQSWTSQNSGTFNMLYSLFFIDSNTGYVCGGYDGRSSIIKTIDGGDHWISQMAGTSNDLRGIYFTDANTGYTVGTKGTILKTSNGGFPVQINEKVLASKKLRIFPNPSTNIINIETSGMPAIGQLSITNLNGVTLRAQEVMQSITKIDISNLPNGIYFVRVTNDKTVEVGKLVKH